MHNLDTARDAGNILRYHVWPTLQSQTNAHHTWNVMRIYAELFGWPIAEVAVYIHYHDVGELDTGDISFVAKRRTPEIKKVVGPIEDEAMERLSFGQATANMLCPAEKERVKLCDLIEMVEFSIEECRLGNMYYGRKIYTNLMEAIHNHPLIDHPDVDRKISKLESDMVNLL